MSEMIERVAKALFVACQEIKPSAFDHMAKAAIEAMREPTEKMIWSTNIGPKAEFIYQSMIDAALKE